MQRGDGYRPRWWIEVAVNKSSVTSLRLGSLAHAYMGAKMWKRTLARGLKSHHNRGPA
jgi:hypothetical protein